MEFKRFQADRVFAMIKNMGAKYKIIEERSRQRKELP